MSMRFTISLAVIGTLVLILVGGSFLGGCTLAGAALATPTSMPGSPPTPTSRVLNAIEIAADNQIHIAETQQVEDIIAKRVSDRTTATAAVTATALSMTEKAREASTQAHIDQVTAQAQARNDASTALARSDNLTQLAVAGAQTQQVWGVTVTAAVVATQTSYPLTQTAQPMHSTAEAASLLARGTQERGNADLTFLTVQRQTMKNGMDAYLPWTLFIVGLVIGTVGLYSYSRYMDMKRDRNGFIGVKMVKHSDGLTFVKPDQMTGAALTVNKQGQITETGSESDFQQQTTRRQQLIEATKGKTVPEFKQVVGMFGAPVGNAGNVNYFDADRRFGKIIGEAEEDMVDGEVIDA